MSFLQDRHSLYRKQEVWSVKESLRGVQWVWRSEGILLSCSSQHETYLNVCACYAEGCFQKHVTHTSGFFDGHWLHRWNSLQINQINRSMLWMRLALWQFDSQHSVNLIRFNTIEQARAAPCWSRFVEGRSSRNPTTRRPPRTRQSYRRWSPPTLSQTHRNMAWWSRCCPNSFQI